MDQVLEPMGCNVHRGDGTLGLVVRDRLLALRPQQLVDFALDSSSSGTCSAARIRGPSA